MGGFSACFGSTLNIQTPGTNPQGASLDLGVLGILHRQPCSALASAHREIWGAAPSTAHCNMPPCQRKNQGVLTYSAVSHKDRLDRWHQNVRSVSDSFINLLQTLEDFERNHIDSTRGCTVAFICKISMGRGSAYLPPNCPD